MLDKMPFVHFWTSRDAVLLGCCVFPSTIFLLSTQFVFPSKTLKHGFYLNQAFPCVFYSHGWVVFLWLPLTPSSWRVHNPWHLPCLFWIFLGTGAGKSPSIHGGEEGRWLSPGVTLWLHFSLPLIFYELTDHQVFQQIPQMLLILETAENWVCTVKGEDMISKFPFTMVLTCVSAASRQEQNTFFPCKLTPPPPIPCPCLYREIEQKKSFCSWEKSRLF